MTPEHRRAELQRAYDNQTPADPETDANPEPGSYDCNLVDEASVERWSDTSPSYGEDGDLQG